MDLSISGEQLRGLRKRRGLTQPQLAERTGISQQRISQIEQQDRYNARLDTLQRLADALGVKVWELAAPGGRAGEEEDRPRDSNVGGAIPTQWVPVYGAVPAAAGQFTPEGTLLPVWSHLLSGVQRPVAVRVDDNNTIQEWVAPGEFAIVDPDAPWSDGRIHLLEMDGCRLLRRVQVRANFLTLCDAGGTERTLSASHVRRLGVVVVFIAARVRPAP